MRYSSGNPPFFFYLSCIFPFTCSLFSTCCTPFSVLLFLLSVFLFSGSSVFGRGNTEFLFEYIAEVVRILISHFFCDLIAFFIGVQHHFFCPVHSVIGKIGDEGLTGFLFKNGRKVRIGYTKICTYIIQREIRLHISVFYDVLCIGDDTPGGTVSGASQFFADGSRHIDNPVCHGVFIELGDSFIKILYIAGDFIEVHGIIGTKLEKSADDLHGSQIVLADGGCILMELFCLFDGFFPDLLLIPYMNGSKQLLHPCFF